MEARNQVLSNLDVRSPGKFACRTESLSPIVDNVCRVIEYARSGRRPIAYVRAIMTANSMFDRRRFYWTRNEVIILAPRSRAQRLSNPLRNSSAPSLRTRFRT